MALSLALMCGLGWSQPAEKRAPSSGTESGGNAPAAPKPAAATSISSTLSTSSTPSTAASPYDDPALLRRVHALLKQTPLIDGHNDTPWQYHNRYNNDLDAIDFRDTTPLERPLKTDITRLRKGGVGAQFWAIYVPPTLEKHAAVTAVLGEIDLVHRLTARYPNDLEMATTADDIVRIHKQGKIASLIGLEGGYDIAESLAVLRMMHQLGARYMTLTHSKSVGWADSATDAPQAHGLTPFGVEVVREMNRLGMIVDLAHVTSETMRAVLDVSRAPVVFTHSNAAALCPHARNVPDDVLLRLKKNGGLVMVTFMPGYITEPAARHEIAWEAERDRLKVLYPDDPGKVREGMEPWKAAHPEPKVTLNDLVDHIDYIKKTIGIDHVGIGSDYEGFSGTPEGLEDVSTYPRIFAELLHRGYTEEEVRKVAGENFLRVMREVEAEAGR